MLLPVGDVLCGAQSGHGPEDEVEEAAGIVDHAAEGVHVHHTHVPQSLARREVGEDLDTEQTHNEFELYRNTGNINTRRQGGYTQRRTALTRHADDEE